MKAGDGPSQPAPAPLELGEELLPAGMRAAIGLLLVGLKPACSMRRCVPALVGVSVKVTTLFRSNAASSCAKFQV